MDDVPVLLEHVDLLDGLDGLDVELLQRGLKLLVVRAGAGGRPLDLPAGSALATANMLELTILSTVFPPMFGRLCFAGRLGVGS